MSHARLSPSASPRWTRCTGSVALEEKIPEGPTSVYAARGTVLHGMSEHTLNTGTSAVSRLYQPGQVIECEGHQIKLTTDDIDQVNEYVNYVRTTLRDYPDAELLVEQKLGMGRFIKGSWGTADAVIIAPFDRVIVIDAKFGRGKVMASSEQLKCYGSAAWERYHEEYGLERVEVTVLQPPLKHIDTVEMSSADVAEFTSWIRPLADEAESGNGKLVAGEHCGFCRAKTICSEFHKKKVGAAMAAFKKEAVPTLAEQMANIDLLKSYIKEVENQVKQALSDGEKIAGFKLVEGRRSRDWMKPDRLMKHLRKLGLRDEEFHVAKLMSPAQLEKVQKETDVDLGLPDFIETKPGSPTVVPETDKRKAIAPAQLAFENTLLD